MTIHFQRRFRVSLAMALTSLACHAFADTDSAKDRSKKSWDIAGFPLVNFTTDRGFGYGAYLAGYFFSKTPKEREPYRASIGGQFYQTTDGYAFHKLLLDFPSILNTNVRLDVVSGYEAWDDANYFGIGNNLPRLYPEETPERYYSYGVQNFWFVPTLRIPVITNWNVFVKASLRTAEVTVYRESLLEKENPRG